jgi:hypothetical protein
MGNRNKGLEEIRRQSLEKWAQEQRRALNEATKNTAVNDRNVAGSTATIAGGSFSNNIGTENQIFFTAYSDNAAGSPRPWRYIYYKVTTGEWSEPIPFGFNDSEYHEITDYPTNGYGVLYVFDHITINDGRRLVYVDSSGAITWDSGLIVTNLQFDIGTGYDIAGTVTCFLGYEAGRFELVTFYKDVKQVFTFDNYIGGTDVEINDSAYGDKVTYMFGDPGQTRTYYALDLLTGSKTALFNVPPNRNWENAKWDYAIDAGWVMPSANAIYYHFFDATITYYEEAKIVDYEGNVLVDILAQCLEQGVNIATDPVNNWWTYGSAYINGDQNHCNILYELTSDDIVIINSATGVHTGLTKPSTDVFQSSGSYERDYIVYSLADGNYTINGNMYFPQTTADQTGFTIISETGVDSTFIFEEAGTPFNYYIDSDNKLVAFGVTSGVLNIVRIDCLTGVETETALSTSIYDDPSDDFQFVSSVVPVTNAGECFFFATDAAAGDVNGYYVQDTYAPVLVHTGPGYGYYTYTNDYGELNPIMYFDQSSNELYVIDRATRTSSEYTIQNATGTNFSPDRIYFRTNDDGYISSDYNNSSEWVFVGANENFIQGNIDTGELAGSTFFGSDYIIITNVLEDIFYIFSRETGALIETVNKPVEGLWIFPAYNNALVYTDDVVTTSEQTRTFTIVIGSSSSTSPLIDYDDIESTWNDTQWWDY